jgi:hypothetical protein
MVGRWRDDEESQKDEMSNAIHSGRRSCAVVDNRDCECPANGMDGDPPPVTCYACGDDVCKSCSTLITYRKRRCRICFTCQDTRRIGRAAVVDRAKAAQ